MTNEQREAIDTLKEITENDLLNYWEGTERPYNAIQIVLSLIKEQQEEIEKKDKQIDLMALAILNYDDQLIINRYKNIDNVKNTFAKLAKKGE